MLIKQIYDEYGLPIERIINKEYKRLGLKLPESMVLLALFSIYERRRNFTIAAISRRVEYTREEIGQYILILQEKGFVKVELEVNKDGREREVFNLDPAFQKIQALIVKDYEEKKTVESAEHIGRMMGLLEDNLGRVLSAYEMDLIRKWYLKDTLTFDDIEKEIRLAISQSKWSINQIDRILMTDKTDTREVDPETARVVKDLFKKLWKKI